MDDEMASQVVSLAAARDRLGRGIDRGIVETVAALNVAGLRSYSSCAGHRDRDTRGPYVMFQHKDSLALEERYRPLSRRDPQYHELLAQAEALNRPILARLIELLDGFYRDRRVATQDRLVVSLLGGGACRLHCQGAALVGGLAVSRRQRLLEAHRAELAAFGRFAMSMKRDAA